MAERGKKQHKRGKSPKMLPRGVNQVAKRGEKATKMSEKSKIVARGGEIKRPEKSFFRLN